MSDLPLPVLLDCDGVLADFDDAALALINQICGTSLTPATLTAWDYFSIPEVAPHEDEIWEYQKHLVDGVMLVDDKPFNVVNWSTMHPDRPAVLFDGPKTSGFSLPKKIGRIIRTSDWDEIVSLL